MTESDDQGARDEAAEALQRQIEETVEDGEGGVPESGGESLRDLLHRRMRQHPRGIAHEEAPPDPDRPEGDA